MAHIESTRITSIVSEYGFIPSELQCQQIRSYISLLLRWNQTVSLTSIISADAILRFHFGESLFALQRLQIGNGRLADVGSGAGFPGLALKVGQPALNLTLLEPNQKKAVFLHEVVRELRLHDVKVLRNQFESLPAKADHFEFITSRALGSHEGLVRFGSSALAKSGVLILWLGKDDVASVSAISELEWKDPIRIPGSKGRFLLAGSRPQ